MEQVNNEAEAVRIGDALRAALPAPLRNVTNVIVQRWHSGVVKVRIRVYDEMRRGEGQGQSG